MSAGGERRGPPNPGFRVSVLACLWWCALATGHVHDAGRACRHVPGASVGAPRVEHLHPPHTGGREVLQYF